MAARLMIVDDDQALRQMLAWHFEEAGYQVTVAGSCRAALEQARAGVLDLALLDYRLPDGTGLDLLARLQALHPRLATVMMSGSSTAPAGAAAGRGAYAFVRKPVRPPQLDDLLARASAAVPR